MARTKFGKRDLNRFRKIYPGVRRTPREVLMTVNPTTVETATLSLNDSDSVTYSFEASFSSTPNVAAACDRDVNIYISNVTSSAVTVKTSAAITGNIYLTIVEIVEM